MNLNLLFPVQRETVPIIVGIVSDVSRVGFTHGDGIGLARGVIGFFFPCVISGEADGHGIFGVFVRGYVDVVRSRGKTDFVRCMVRGRHCEIIVIGTVEKCVAHIVGFVQFRVKLRVIIV